MASIDINVLGGQVFFLGGRRVALISYIVTMPVQTSEEKGVNLNEQAVTVGGGCKILEIFNQNKGIRKTSRLRIFLNM